MVHIKKKNQTEVFINYIKIINISVYIIYLYRHIKLYAKLQQKIFPKKNIYDLPCLSPLHILVSVPQVYLISGLGDSHQLFQIKRENYIIGNYRIL